MSFVVSTYKGSGSFQGCICLRNTENMIRAGAEISPLFQRIGVTKRWWICPFGAWTLSAPHNLALNAGKYLSE
jgi:hypothetical protein